MSRLILWAAGALAMVALSGTTIGGQIARGILSASPSRSATSSGEIATAPRVMSLDADLLGHYTVHPVVQGRRVTMLVDTGASLVALTSEDAEAAGIRVDPRLGTRRMMTANGAVDVGSVRLTEVRVGDIAVRDVDAVIMPKGRLGTSLLGMSFLKRLGGFEVTRGRLTLRG